MYIIVQNSTLEHARPPSMGSAIAIIVLQSLLGAIDSQAR